MGPVLTPLVNAVLDQGNERVNVRPPISTSGRDGRGHQMLIREQARQRKIPRWRRQRAGVNQHNRCEPHASHRAWSS